MFCGLGPDERSWIVVPTSPRRRRGRPARAALPWRRCHLLARHENGPSCRPNADVGSKIRCPRGRVPGSRCSYGCGGATFKERAEGTYVIVRPAGERPAGSLAVAPIRSHMGRVRAPRWCLPGPRRPWASAAAGSSTQRDFRRPLSRACRDGQVPAPEGEASLTKLCWYSNRGQRRVVPTSELIGSCSRCGPNLNLPTGAWC